MENIDTLVRYATQKWRLFDMKKISRVDAAINFLIIARSALYKTDVVLKIIRDGSNEIEALRYFNGQGSINLLDYDSTYNLILLPYIRSGVDLTTFFPQADDEATYIFADVVKKLHAVQHQKSLFNFDSVGKIIHILITDACDNNFHDLCQDAYEKAKMLLKKNTYYLILHGDLHHENIIQCENGWLAIDPKGIEGPLDYEVARYLFNPIPHCFRQPNTEELIRKRIAILADIFCLFPDDLQNWAYILALLSAIWAKQDGQLFLKNYFFECALFFKKLKI